VQQGRELLRERVLPGRELLRERVLPQVPELQELRRLLSLRL
jgi:hypothetical protein